MIHHIIFDLGGVIITLTPDVARERFRRMGIRDAFELMGTYGHRDIFLQCENGTLSASEFCQRLSERVGREVSFEEAQYGWMGYAKEVPMHRLHFLDRLRAEGYSVMLLSNTRSSAFCDERRPITSFFDRMYLSYELKLYKPDPAFFRYALNDAGIKAEETLFIDDSQTNLDSASSVGIHTMLARTDVDWTQEMAEMLKI